MIEQNTNTTKIKYKLITDIFNINIKLKKNNNNINSLQKRREKIIEKY